MAIAVNCRCGKRFKVKDRLAGKAVRCPACKQPLRIPGAGTGRGTAARPSADGSAPAKKASKIDEKAAILRFEAAQRQKENDAEAEAAYQDERNKLIEGYDQAAGRIAKGKKKKGLPAPGKPRKPTLFTKLADACWIVCGTLAFKYVFCAVLLSGGVVGSIYGIQRLWSYAQEQSGPAAPKEVRCEACFKQAEEAIKAERWGEAREALEELLRIEPRFEKHRRYKELIKRIDEGFGGG